MISNYDSETAPVESVEAVTFMNTPSMTLFDYNRNYSVFFELIHKVEKNRLINFSWQSNVFLG